MRDCVFPDTTHLLYVVAAGREHHDQSVTRVAATAVHIQIKIYSAPFTRLLLLLYVHTHVFGGTRVVRAVS